MVGLSEVHDGSSTNGLRGQRVYLMSSRPDAAAKAQGPGSTDKARHSGKSSTAVKWPQVVEKGFDMFWEGATSPAGSSYPQKREHAMKRSLSKYCENRVKVLGGPTGVRCEHFTTYFLTEEEGKDRRPNPALALH